MEHLDHRDRHSDSESSVDSGHYPDTGDAALDGIGAPTHAAIAAKAHELWIAQGCPPDSAIHNWLEAEKELRLAGTGKQGSHVAEPVQRPLHAGR